MRRLIVVVLLALACATPSTDTNADVGTYDGVDIIMPGDIDTPMWSLSWCWPEGDDDVCRDADIEGDSSGYTVDIDLTDAGQGGHWVVSW